MAVDGTVELLARMDAIRDDVHALALDVSLARCAEAVERVMDSAAKGEFCSNEHCECRDLAQKVEPLWNVGPPNPRQRVWGASFWSPCSADHGAMVQSHARNHNDWLDYWSVEEAHAARTA